MTTVQHYKLGIDSKNDDLGDTEITCEHSRLVSVTNNSLALTKGYRLAIIDENDSIVKQGTCVETEIFDAMTTKVVEAFCKRFKGFSDADFKARRE